MGSRTSKAAVPRCWCCGTRFVDEARLRNERAGIAFRRFPPTGNLVCPNGCPTKEEYDRLVADREEDLTAVRTANEAAGVKT